MPPGERASRGGPQGLTRLGAMVVHSIVVQQAIVGQGAIRAAAASLAAVERAWLIPARSLLRGLGVVGLRRSSSLRATLVRRAMRPRSWARDAPPGEAPGLRAVSGRLRFDGPSSDLRHPTGCCSSLAWPRWIPTAGSPTRLVHHVLGDTIRLNLDSPGTETQRAGLVVPSGRSPGRTSGRGGAAKPTSHPVRRDRTPLLAPADCVEARSCSSPSRRYPLPTRLHCPPYPADHKGSRPVGSFPPAPRHPCPLPLCWRMSAPSHRPRDTSDRQSPGPPSPTRPRSAGAFPTTGSSYRHRAKTPVTGSSPRISANPGCQPIASYASCVTKAPKAALVTSVQLMAYASSYTLRCG